MVTDDGPHHDGSLDDTDAFVISSTDEAHQSTPDGTQARKRQLQLVAHPDDAHRRVSHSDGAPMVMLRTRRLIQRDAMSRTTMRVRIPTHAGAKLVSTDGGNGRIRRHNRCRSSSSTDADDTSPDVRHRQCIKPRTFDGSELFEWFLVQFENCASYNRWNTADKMQHLKTSLSSDAGHVM